MIDDRVCPGGRSDPLWIVVWGLARVGVEPFARVMIAGSGEGAPAGSAEVRDQNRMVAGPSWRVLADWPGFLTG